MDQEISFEEALRALETAVDQLEGGDLSLEESLAVFEEGQKLARMCQNFLEKAALRVEALTADGEIAPLDLETGRPGS